MGERTSQNWNEREEAASKLSALSKKWPIVSKSKQVYDKIENLKEKPEISIKSHYLAERRNSNIRIKDRYEMELRKKKNRLNKLKQQLEDKHKEEERELTFHPRINNKSKYMSRERIDKNVGKNITWIINKLNIYIVVIN